LPDSICPIFRPNYAKIALYAATRLAAFESKGVIRFAPPIRDRSDPREYVARGNHYYRNGEFDNALRRWVADIAGKSPLLLAMGKRAVAATRDLPLESALDYLQAQLALAFTTEDLPEGVKAFKEKRPPQWRNA